MLCCVFPKPLPDLQVTVCQATQYPKFIRLERDTMECHLLVVTLIGNNNTLKINAGFASSFVLIQTNLNFDLFFCCLLEFFPKYVFLTYFICLSSFKFLYKFDGETYRPITTRYTLSHPSCSFTGDLTITTTSLTLTLTLF